MENNNIDHEMEFLKDVKDNDRFIVIAGSTSSGKTYFIVSFVNMAVMYRLFDEVHVISPTINVEVNGSYDFMKYNKIFKLYSQFNTTIIDEMKRDTTKRKLLICDDATSYLMENKYNTNLTELVTCVRHYRVTMFCLIHSLSYVLLPVLRQNVSHMFIGNYMNDGVIKKVWEQFLSRKIRRYENFYLPYDESQKEKQNLIYLCTRADGYNGIEYHVKKWEILQYHDKITKNGNAMIIKPKTEDQKYVEKVKGELHKKQIKKKLIPQNYKFNVVV